MIIEKICKKHGMTFHVQEISKYFRCKKCRSESVSRRRRNVKRKLVEIFGGKCQRCGYSRCAGVLEFHHKDPTQKSFGLSEKGRTIAFQQLLIEAKKCELLCANCHREHECKFIGDYF